MKMTGHIRAHAGRVCMLAACCAFMLVFACLLGGCKNSDVIKEILYDQDAEITEPDTTLAVWKYDSNSDLVSKKVRQSEDETTDGIVNEQLPRALYNSTAGKEHTAAQFEYAPDARYDCESTGTVTYVYDKNAPYKPGVNVLGGKQEPEDEEAEQQEEEDEQENLEQQQDQNVPNQSDRPEGEDGANGDENDDEGDSEEKSAGSTGTKQKDESQGGGEAEPADDFVSLDDTSDVSLGDNEGSGDDFEEIIDDQASGDDDSGVSGGDSQPDVDADANNNLSHYNANSSYGEIPSYNTAVAYGPYAVALQMVTGGGVLVGADSDLLSGGEGIAGGFSEVFADEGAAGLTPVWAGDGTETTDADIDNIVALKPDTVIVTAKGELSSAQQKKLSAAGIDYTVVKAMTSDANIKATVTLLAKIFKDSNVKSGSVDSEEVAKSYTKWVNKTVSDIEGGYGYVAHMGKVLNDEVATPSIASGENTKYTLLIDGWNDEDAYKGSYHGFKPDASQGVALATCGYKNSPVSYFMGVGGAVNVPAVLNWAKSNLGKKAVVWQYSYSSLDPNKWDGSVDVKLEATDQLLVVPSAPYGGNTESRSYDVTNLNGFGTDEYPAAIVASQDMRTRMLNDMMNVDGLYYPNAVDNTSDIAYVGRRVKGYPLRSCIGQNANATMSVLSGADGAQLASRVLVNPHGMCCSWIQGSPESVLESAWVASQSVFRGGNAISVADVEGYVADFYGQFYRYDIDADAIDAVLAGKES